MRTFSPTDYRFQKVLNGLFGVAKSSQLEDGRSVLRVIMNLIPSNASMVQLKGGVKDLPQITQYLSLVLEQGEILQISQADITAAFYLFGLPMRWMRYLCFNLKFSGAEIGKEKNKEFYLACGVLPMGWASAVSVMQEVSEGLLLHGGLPRNPQIRRTKPLPAWLVECIKKGEASSQAWWHVYLDNFFSGEKVRIGETSSRAKELHEAAEKVWQEVGVISSEKKRVLQVTRAEELGALFASEDQYFGASGERLVKLIQLTAVVLSRPRPPIKWLQVVCGRWVHIFQFRRVGMCTLHYIWSWISGKKIGGKGIMKARRELVMCLAGACLFHSDLGAKCSSVTSASDASGTGGAVSISRSLTAIGKEFVAASAKSSAEVIKPKTLVLCLFNGIGGCFKCYDIVGVSPAVLISYEISAAANRVVSRRWPHCIIGGDVRSITEEVVRGWYYEYPDIEEIHLWGGFPCVDLSSVRHNRMNLAGKDSGLFFEILRVLKLLKQVFGISFKIVFFIENVSSMDKSAAREIGSRLGCKPYKVQCSDAVPVSRPRFCWTNRRLPPLRGVVIIEKEDYLEVRAEAQYPSVEDWITPGWSWQPEDPEAVFPTCMKAIRRSRPPPAPAGISRCNEDTISRWVSQDYKYPPYQFKEDYILWKGWTWRLINGGEREILHGYGFEHTSLCMSASDIKKSYSAYEDQRCSLIGDSFSIYSFCIFVWGAFKDSLPDFDYQHLCNRMGMAPGFVCPISRTCVLGRRPGYGSTPMRDATPKELAQILLQRTNHTGSDIRITTGQVMCPKAFPRQSVASCWWNWVESFSCRWARKDHINSLELRAIVLALKQRVLREGERNVRFVHLTDSYVNMSILSKGRTSSEMLLFQLRRFAAVVFGFNLYPLLAHVESTDNPTDEGSRK